MEEKNNKNKNVLFLIEVKAEEKFGLISSNLIILIDNKYLRPNSSLLFPLKTEVKIYTHIDSREDIIYIRKKIIFF